MLRPHFAQLMGLGGPERNVYAGSARGLGFGAAVDRLHARLAAGDRAGAAATVPLEFIDELAMIGSVDRVAERMGRYAEAGATTLGIMVAAASLDTPGRLRLLADAAEAWRRSGCQDRRAARIG